jgi:Ca2+-binding RTX toxin-like protein
MRSVWAPTRVAALAIVPFVCLVSVAFTASNSVPGSRADRAASSIGVNNLKPNACNALTLAGITTGSGTVNDGAGNNLVLGSAAVDTMRGNGGNDCLVGGASNDSLRGDAGTDVCIGGLGTDTFHSSCETQIQ